MRKKEAVGMLFILPSLAGVLLFYLVPFFLTLCRTFTQGIAHVHFVGWANFKELLQNPAFLLAASNTLIFIGVGVPILTLGALFLSAQMAQKLYAFPRWAMLSPMVIPVASALMGYRLLFDDGGAVNGILQWVGVSPVDFLGESIARWTLILIFVLKNLGYMTVIFTGGMTSLSKEYKEAFLLDSSSTVRYVFRIVIPLLLPLIFFVVILGIVNSFLMFREMYGLYGNYPPDSLYTLQHFMNNNFMKLNHQRLSTAAFLLIFGFSVLVSWFLWFQNKYLRG